jgi:alkanesulfonate monooxygenase SsuD/methylene tetrahydromethanopterin reductase-like flavin-dependent oxidoreductase (luciferase family)
LAVKVGVLLDREPSDIGEWLADAAAFDAGGADALWIDPGPEWDVLALAAALAVITFRARLVVALPSSSGAGPARTLDTVGRLSHGRLGSHR